MCPWTLARQQTLWSISSRTTKKIELCAEPYQGPDDEDPGGAETLLVTVDLMSISLLTTVPTSPLSMTVEVRHRLNVFEAQHNGPRPPLSLQHMSEFAMQSRQLSIGLRALQHISPHGGGIATADRPGQGDADAEAREEIEDARLEHNNPEDANQLVFQNRRGPS
jgi:hypothetical protein